MFNIFNNEEKILETTLFATYSDFYGGNRIICDPRGKFEVSSY